MTKCFGELKINIDLGILDIGQLFKLLLNPQVGKRQLGELKYLSNCRNLPFGGRATRGSRVRLPWEENARSRHQRLFEENVGKTEKVWSTNFNRERFGRCFYAREMY